VVERHVAADVEGDADAGDLGALGELAGDQTAAAEAPRLRVDDDDVVGRAIDPNRCKVDAGGEGLARADDLVDTLR
jgi:hypothetical protein